MDITVLFNVYNSTSICQFNIPFNPFDFKVCFFHPVPWTLQLQLEETYSLDSIFMTSSSCWPSTPPRVVSIQSPVQPAWKGKIYHVLTNQLNFLQTNGFLFTPDLIMDILAFLVNWSLILYSQQYIQPSPPIRFPFLFQFPFPFPRLSAQKRHL